MGKRPAAGRGLLYTRDSEGRNETTPGEYVRWAQSEAARLGLAFSGTPERIDAMIRNHSFHDEDLFLDYAVPGNRLERLGLGTLIRTVQEDPAVSHVFIPRRDRLARPDDPIDGMKLENLLREAGATLVFLDRTLTPLARGRRRDVGEMIVAMLDYNAAGEFRGELAEKMIRAQLALARAGYSTGGRPPYAFRRWLVREDGTPVRQLEDREYVRRPGHHVVWLPGPETELAVVRRILNMLETMPASRVAATLTVEGVPAPDSGRHRTDRGVRHPTSGVWHQTTVVNIARNPLLLAVVNYGRRSMGDQRRFTPEGPRALEEADLRPDGRPKVVANPETARVTAPARFEPLVDPDRHRQLLQTLDERGGTQRGKPRSRDPKRNPLGGRLFDMACGWPMYRQPYSGSFRYLCGFYQQSHGASCGHHHVDGMAATRFLLASIRQRVLVAPFVEKLREKLRAIAERERGTARPDPADAARRAKLAELGRQRQQAELNLALAQNADQYRAVAAVFERLRQQEEALAGELRGTQRATGSTCDVDVEVAAALAALDHLVELAGDGSDLESVRELFLRLNARLFLRFQEVTLKKRRVNRVAGGVVTFGSTPPPRELYAGPTGRRALQEKLPEAGVTGLAGVSSQVIDDVREGESLGNVNRGERIRSFVNETSGLELVWQMFPQTLAFPGDRILQLVKPGVYRKHRKATGGS